MTVTFPGLHPSTRGASAPAAVPVYVSAGEIGGVEQVGRQVRQALASEPGGARLVLGAAGIATSRRPRGPWVSLTWKAEALVRARHPRLAARSLLWLHGAELTRDRSELGQRLRARTLASTDVFLAVSPLATGLLPDHLRERVQLVGPPIVTPRDVSRRRDGAGSRPAVAPDVIRLVSVGRADPRKGHDSAIQVAAALARDVAVRLDVVGPGPDLRRLRQLAGAAARPGLEIRVRGQVPEAEKHQLYADADALLFLPRTEAGEYEGLGLVVLEAAAHGCPAVVQDCGGSRYGVVPGRTGFVLPEGTQPSEYANAVRALMALPQAREAAKRFAHHFRLDDWQARVRAITAGAAPDWQWPDDA